MKPITCPSLAKVSIVALHYIFYAYRKLPSCFALGTTIYAFYLHIVATTRRPIVHLREKNVLEATAQEH